MKTGIDESQDVFDLLNVVSIKSLINGDLYLFERPQNSKLKDIVIGVLASSNEQMQKAVLNVNIHCPNLTGVTLDNINDATMPDIKSLKDISLIATSILNNYRGDTFFLYAQNTGIPIRDEKSSDWFINIRVNYHSFQNNYTNI